MYQFFTEETQSILCRAGKTHSVKHPDVLQKLEREELQERMSDAVNKLPEKQRIAVILRTYHALSHKEISDILGCSVGTRKANYFHALRNFVSLYKPLKNLARVFDHEM